MDGTHVFGWLLLSLLTTAVLGADVHGVKSSVPNGLTNELQRFSSNKADLADAYQRLHSVDWDGPASYNEQMLSMTDAMLGRYAQAQQEMDSAFQITPSLAPACPDKLGAGAFDHWLKRHAGRFNLVMINEAHNQPVSRSLIYQMLPMMRTLGFSILALEVLPDVATANSINRRGFVEDDRNYGFYLREPIESEVVREAKRLGFTLASYDVFSEHREQDQAANIARILEKNRGKKVLVVAGYDHVRRIDDRMGSLMPTLYGKPFLSIDQLGMGEDNDVMHSVCYLKGSTGSGPVAGSLASMRWITGRRGTDIAVVRPGIYSLDRSGRVGSEWLSLGGDRWRYRFNTAQACGASATCLVEARYASEAKNAVPADRYLAVGSEQTVDLYLRDDKYVVTYRKANGAVVHSNTLTTKAGKLIH